MTKENADIAAAQMRERNTNPPKPIAKPRKRNPEHRAPKTPEGDSRWRELGAEDREWKERKAIAAHNSKNSAYLSRVAVCKRVLADDPDLRIGERIEYYPESLRMHGIAVLKDAAAIVLFERKEAAALARLMAGQ